MKDDELKQNFIKEVNFLDTANKINEVEMKMGIMEEYLKKIYTCVDRNNNKDTSSTSVLPLHNLKKKSLKQTFENINLDIFSNALIVDEIKGNQITQRSQIMENIGIAERFILNFNMENEESLLIYGNTGTGKTFLSNCIANYLIKEGYKVRSYSSIELFDMIKETLIVDKVNIGEYKMLTECDLLIIDDLGIESNTNFTDSYLFSILNSRISNYKKTIICTNMTIQEIKNNYSDMIFSRIVDVFRFCKISGYDLRW